MEEVTESGGDWETGEVSLCCTIGEKKSVEDACEMSVGDTCRLLRWTSGERFSDSDDGGGGASGSEEAWVDRPETDAAGDVGSVPGSGASDALLVGDEGSGSVEL